MTSTRTSRHAGARGTCGRHTRGGHKIQQSHNPRHHTQSLWNPACRARRGATKKTSGTGITASLAHQLTYTHCTCMCWQSAREVVALSRRTNRWSKTPTPCWCSACETLRPTEQAGRQQGPPGQRWRPKTRLFVARSSGGGSGHPWGKPTNRFCRRSSPRAEGRAAMYKPSLATW